MSASNSHSPCAACKFLRRKCTQECVFAPYFPPDQPQKFASVHRVYGASNVAKILNEMPGAHREEAVASLAYEAEARLRDPVYGCVGFISYLHARLKQVQSETLAARKEIAAYLSSSDHSPSSQAAAAAAMMMMYPNYPSAAAPAAINNNNAQIGFLQSHHQNQMMFALDNQAYTGDGVGIGGGDVSCGALGLVVDNGEVYPVAQQLQQPHHQQQQQAHEYLHHQSGNNNIEAQLLLSDGNSNVSQHNHHHHHHHHGHQDHAGADIDYNHQER